MAPAHLSTGNLTQVKRAIQAIHASFSDAVSIVLSSTVLRLMRIGEGSSSSSMHQPKRCILGIDKLCLYKLMPILGMDQGIKHLPTDNGAISSGCGTVSLAKSN